jgi:hypothetical protein
VVVFDAGTGSVTASIACGEYPSIMAHNPVENRVYVLDIDGWTIFVIRDSMPTGVEESPGANLQTMSVPNIVRGVLLLGEVDSRQQTGYRAELLDVAGRSVMELQSGANDVSRLTPGVYFMHSTIANPQATIAKIVLTK